MYNVLGLSLRKLIRLRFFEKYDDREIVAELVALGLPLKVARSNVKRAKREFFDGCSSSNDATSPSSQVDTPKELVAFASSEGGRYADGDSSILSFRLQCFGGTCQNASWLGSS